ncbi:hypothetical protein G3I50_24620 [Streptomyces parvus]|uniref:Uncharacterized protein n=1 Tax=Streptomyces parvus TaxID=66428 RepID=A0A7K3S1M9_9ACTN|nr:hypothetical protein [Streptomyces parvus]
MGRRRSKVFLTLATGLVALAVVLTGAFWPDGSGGSDEAGGNGDRSGEGARAAAAARGASAARTLDSLPGVRLSMVYAPGGGKPVTQAELTVTAEGMATGTLDAPVTGRAAMAWSGDQLYLKGDTDFWAQQGPHYGRDVSSSGHWVAPEKRDGYSMLSSFGVNAGSLNPKSLAALVRQVTADPAVVQEAAGSFQGRKAVAYTARGRTVTLADDAMHPLVAFEVNPADADPIETASWRSPSSSRGIRTAGLVVTGTGRALSDDDRFYNPSVVARPKPVTDAAATAVRAAAAEAKAAAVPPLTSAQQVKASQGPVFTIRDNDAYLCTTKPCSYSFTVTNDGNQPGDATLHVNFPGIPDRVHPLGELAPGESRDVSGTRPNIAGPGQTVRHTDHAWVYSTAVYGPDPEVAQRLHARALAPDDVFVATPLQPRVATLLDLMTKNAPKDDRSTNEKAVEVLRDVNSRGQLPLVMTLAASGRLQNPENLAENLATTDKIGDARVLQQVAHIMKTDPTARVWYDGKYESDDGEAYTSDYTLISTRGGQETRRAAQVKTVESWKRLWTRVGDAVEQLNGEHKMDTARQRQEQEKKRPPEKAPPGFERVAQINLEQSVGRGYHYSRTELEQFLRSKNYAQARHKFCKKNGELGIERLVIVNATGTHQWTDLSTLGVPCRKAER